MIFLDNIKIGNFIKLLRKKKKMTQKELADKLGITDRAVSRWERGIGCPDISLLESLADILGVSVLELLKGEYIDDEKEIDEGSLLETMKLSRNNVIYKIKRWYNYLTVLVVIVICLFIVITNIKSVYLLNKSYDMDIYNIEDDSADIIKEFNNKVEIIMNNQGKYEDRDYSRIRSNMKIMKERLAEQNNKKYLGKKKYSYIDLVQFYVDHGNLRTMEIDNMDIYRILVDYDGGVSDNMVRYEFDDQRIKENISYMFFALEEPYFMSNDSYQYIGNIDSIVRVIYEREIRLCDDIIRVGGLG